MKDKSVVFIETCYRLYEQKMYAVAYRILKDRYLAEDVVQETFLKLMRKNVYFEDAESTECKGYLIKTLKHSAIDIYRKREKEREREFLSDDASEYEGETTGNHNRLMDNNATDKRIIELYQSRNEAAIEQTDVHYGKFSRMLSIMLTYPNGTPVQVDMSEYKNIWKAALDKYR